MSNLKKKILALLLVGLPVSFVAVVGCDVMADPPDTLTATMAVVYGVVTEGGEPVSGAEYNMWADDTGTCPASDERVGTPVHDGSTHSDGTFRDTVVTWDNPLDSVCVRVNVTVPKNISVSTEPVRLAGKGKSLDSVRVTIALPVQ